MKKWMILACLVVILQVTLATSASEVPLPQYGPRPFESPLPQPFVIEPFDTEVLGSADANTLGSFRQDGGPQLYRYFLGTDLTPGRLIMVFSDPFTDGPGNDFAIQTHSQGWGPDADEAQFQFYFGNTLRASFVASLTPDQVFQFELPGSGLVANRVIVTNVTPDPAGTNDLATMAFDNAGVAHLCSLPAAPSLTAPADGSSTCDTTPTFDWSDVSGATSYRIQVDNDSNFGSPAVDTTTSTSAYTPGAALSPGVYHWRVLSRNACGGGAWSATWTVTVRSAPAAPSLTAPADGSSACDTTPTFDWSDVGGATSYDLQVDDSPGFASPAIDTTTSNSSYTPGAALPPGTYHWRARARNACGGGAWSATRTVTVRSAPAAPLLAAPPDGSRTCDSTPLFNWSDVSGATSYRIQVDNDSNFGSPAVDTTISTSAYTPGAALLPGTYHWRVLSRNACGDGAWSATRTVTVLAPPDSPVLQAPDDDSTTDDSTPSFDWSDASGATSYDIQVDDSPGFGSPAIEATTPGSSYTPDSALPDGAYYWRARASNGCGGGSWSSARRLTIATEPTEYSVYLPLVMWQR